MSKARNLKSKLISPDFDKLERQRKRWDWVMDHYFRIEFDGFENAPEQNCLVIGNHGGGALAMDGWMMFFAWWRHFGRDRPLNGTAHDVLMKLPVLGSFFNSVGVVSPSRENLEMYLHKGRDVLLFPGGEEDALRAWKRRDEVVLGGRKGFIRLAIRSGVPILPIATCGGHDCEFILSEGRWLAKTLRFPQLLRSNIAPITLSVPFGVTLEILPWHVPLPAKIRAEILEPLVLDDDPGRADDEAYVNEVYDELTRRMQASVDKLAERRRFPVFA